LTPDLLPLGEDIEMGVHFRPVLPIVVRSKATLFAGDRRRVQYIVIDSLRPAEFLGMKTGSPDWMGDGAVHRNPRP
jgi:hypothetical protein